MAIEVPLGGSAERRGLNVTEEFMRGASWADISAAHKDEPLLEIHLDLRNQDRLQFILWARRAKTLMDSGSPGGQQCVVSIKCTLEQKAWELNVFTSGVEWEKP